MYSDRVAATGRKRSVKERLGSNAVDNFPSYVTQNNVKRQRQGDEKWKHDLYDDEEEGELPRVSNGQAAGQDLRTKLQQKTSYRGSQSGNDNQSGFKDLREKLAGTTQPRPTNADASRRIVSVVKGSSQAKSVAPSKAVAQPASAPSRTVHNQAPPVLQGEELSVANLLQSLGLGKYLITFQAEEVDMAALKHMGDEDLKVLGIPMGPRKKILLALDSHSKG